MSVTEANPKDEFDAAFAEATGAKPAAEAPPPSGSDAPAEKVEPKAEASAPAPEAPPADSPQGEQASAPSEPSPEDKLKELERKVQEAGYRERQSAGRASQNAKLNAQLQQQLEEQRRRVAELEAAQAARQKTAAVAAPENDALAEAPELRHAVQYLVQQQLGPLAEELAAARARLQEVEPLAARALETAKPLAEQQLHQTIAETQSAMDREFPGWRQERDTSQFQNWLGAQPRPIQDLYEHGMTFAECQPVMALYSAQTGRLTKPAPAQAAAAPAPAASAQDRLRTSSGIAPRVARVIPPVDLDDYDGAWEEATKGK